MPRLQAMYEDYGIHGFMPISINLQEDLETVKTWARLYDYLHLLDAGSVWAVYNQTSTIPTNYVIDTSGVIRYVATGFNEAAVRAAIQPWLPDPIEHEVGVTLVLAPAGNVDSAQSVVPACSLYNSGPVTETYPVRVRIGTRFDTTATVTGHAPGTARYLEFPAWTALERGQLTVACSTELAGDDITGNDEKTGLVSVRVYDLAVTAILAPTDSVDSAATVVPMAEVRNLGTVADMGRVRFTIGDFYLDSVNVPLQPGVCDTAVLPSWTAAQLGTFSMRCSVSGRWEMVPGNNVATGSVVVVPAGIAEPGRPAALAFFELHPNPAGARSEVSYSLARPGFVDLRVYSASGSLVRTLAAGLEAAGEHSVAWDGYDEAGQSTGRGIYYCRLAAGGFEAVRKLVRTE